MQKLTEKQKKTIAVIILVLAGVHFGPKYVNQFASSVRAAKSAPTRDEHAQPTQQAPSPLPPPPPPPEVAALSKYGGVWVGSELSTDQDRCDIRLEIRVGDDKKLKGYESKNCIPLQPLAGGRPTKGTVADLIRETAPVSAVMTGTPHDGGISFTVDRTIGAPTDGCGDLSAFTMTDFGEGQAQAEFQEGKCPATRMLLRKAKG
jgi:hypothetical protein